MSCLYLDSSVVLRYIYRQPEFLDLRTLSETIVASTLTQVECLRTLDRLRLERKSDPATLQKRKDALAELLDHAQMMELTKAILFRAGSPLTVPLATLDAIHLVSALQWRETHDEPLIMATHDRTLARAARLYQLEVVGAAGG